MRADGGADDNPLLAEKCRKLLVAQLDLIPAVHCSNDRRNARSRSPSVSCAAWYVVSIWRGGRHYRHDGTEDVSAKI